MYVCEGPDVGARSLTDVVPPHARLAGARIRCGSMRRGRLPSHSLAGGSSVCLSPLVELLREHLSKQERERMAARQLWSGGGCVFANEIGQPINFSTDYHAWKGAAAEGRRR
jgi:hypothetical protein